MRRRREPILLSRLLGWALLCTFSLGCGDDGGGNGGSTIPTTSGRDSTLLNAYGSFLDMSAPFREFDFGAGEMVTGTFGEPAGGDVAFMLEDLEDFTAHYYFSTGGNGGGIDMGTVGLASITEAPETGYTGTVDLGGTELDSDWSLLIGRTFCVLTRDGAHYAKMEIVDADWSGRTITFDWVYLPEGGRVFP